MELSESMRPADRPEARNEVDVRQEAEDMVARHARQMKDLEANTVDESSFETAALKATDAFMGDLEKFLTSKLEADEAQQLMSELTKPLRDDLRQYLEPDAGDL